MPVAKPRRPTKKHLKLSQRIWYAYTYVHCSAALFDNLGIGAGGSGFGTLRPNGETRRTMAFQGRRAFAMSQRRPWKAIVLQTAEVLRINNLHNGVLQNRCGFAQHIGGKALAAQESAQSSGLLLVFMVGILRATAGRKSSCGEKFPKLRAEKLLNNSKVFI